MTTLWITIFWATILLSAASYFLYPALVWLWGRLLPFKPLTRDHQPSISILIAAFNEERDIAAKLSNTLELDYPPEQFEILVGSDGSSDQTASIVKTFADRGVRLLNFEENRGKTAVQNDLVATSHGDILVFTDAAFLPAAGGHSQTGPPLRGPPRRVRGRVHAIRRYRPQYHHGKPGPLLALRIQTASMGIGYRAPDRRGRSRSMRCGAKISWPCPITLSVIF